MNRTRSGSTFYKIYFGVLAVGFVALIIACFVVRGYLAEYENSQPKHVAQEIFDTYFDPVDFDALLTVSGTEVSELTDRSALVNFLSSSVSGKEITFYTVSTGAVDTDTVKFLVKAGDDKLASFTVVKTGEKSGRGFELYELGTMELYISADASVTVCAPAGSTVCVDSLTLTSADADETYLNPDAMAYLPDDIEGVPYEKFVIEGLLEQPESVTVTDKNGVACDLTLDTKTNTYTAALMSDPALEEEYADYIIDYAQLYAAYTQSDGWFGSFSSYLDPNSDLYENIRTTEVYFVWDHYGYAFNDVVASQFYRLSDDTITCRVSMTHVLMRTGYEDFEDFIDITFFLHEVDGTYLIYDTCNNG